MSIFAAMPQFRYRCVIFLSLFWVRGCACHYLGQAYFSNSALLGTLIIQSLHDTKEPMHGVPEGGRRGEAAPQISTEILKVGQILLESWASLHLSGRKVNENWTKLNIFIMN